MNIIFILNKHDWNIESICEEIISLQEENFKLREDRESMYREIEDLKIQESDKESTINCLLSEIEILKKKQNGT